MQKQQVLHCNAEEVGAALLFRNIRRYTVMQKYQALQSNEGAGGATM
jgi:hypothetical protein